jgi:mRNA-degrading endonuclease RelE of RelBE toxin-antitoxin system
MIFSMSYNIELTDNFKKEAKKLIKKYASLRTEITELGKELAENPTMGTPLGNDVYKIRLSISSKNKGKSGGARIISFVKIINETVYLLSIYNKGEKNNISDKEIEQLLQGYL